jgi:sugar phosphate isomerase/epimerase
MNGLVREGEMDVFRFLDTARYRYRLDYADIWTEGSLKDLSDAYIARVRTALNDTGITLANLCVDGPVLWPEDESKRAGNKTKMLEYLDVAKELGAQTIRIDFGGPSPWGRKPDAPPYTPYTMTDEALAYIAETFREYCGIVASFGAKIGPENHWGWDGVTDYLIKVKEKVNHPAYGHLFHITHFVGDVALGEKYAIETAMHTHVPANSIPIIKSYVKKLIKADYAGVYSIEHHSRLHELIRTDWQLASLRAILAEINEEGVDAEDTEDFLHSVYFPKPQPAM